MACRMRSTAPAPDPATSSSSQPSAVVLGRITSPPRDDDSDVVNDDVVNDAVINDGVMIDGVMNDADDAVDVTVSLVVARSTPNISSSSSSAGCPSLSYDDHFRSVT